MCERCQQLEAQLHRLIEDMGWVRQCLLLRKDGGLRPVRPADWGVLICVIEADLKKARELACKARGPGLDSKNLGR